VFFLARIAAIRNDDDEVGQLLPQDAWWQHAFHSVSALEARGNGTAKPICGHATNMGLEGHLLHCDAQLSKIREAFGVPDPEEILKSSNIDLSHAEESAGKSGAKMIFSDDKKYIIKTMSSRDLNALKGVIDAYTYHIVGHATNSEMMRLYAIVEDPEHGMWLIGNNWLPMRFPSLGTSRAPWWEGKVVLRNARRRTKIGWPRERSWPFPRDKGTRCCKRWKVIAPCWLAPT